MRSACDTQVSYSFHLLVLLAQLASEEAKNFKDKNLFVVLIPNKAVLQKAKEEPYKKRGEVSGN